MTDSSLAKKILERGVGPLIAAMKNFYAGLEDDDIRLVVDKLYPRKIKKGDFFIKEGEIGGEIGFCVNGLFRQYYLKGDKEINTNFLLENDFLLAYPSMLRQQPSRYFIRALENSEIIVYPTHNTEQLYCATRNWERYGRRVAQWVVLEMSDQLEQMLFSIGKERYDALLKRRPDWIQRVPLKYLSSYLGIKQETLSRLRSQKEG